MRANNLQVKSDPNYRQRNDIHYNHFLQPDQTPIPNRKNRMGGNRSRAQSNRKQFELNRDRGNGIRQRIQFNSTNNAHDRQFNRNRAWRQHHQRFNTPMTPANTINPTPWPITNPPGTSSPITTTAPTRPTTSAPTTTTTTTVPPPPAPPILTSNDVTQYEDSQYQKQLEEAEQQRYDEKLRRQQESIENARRIEQERIQNEERMRNMHQIELERRQQEAINEQQRARENERIQNEKRQQDFERQQQNEMNRQRYEEAEQNRQAELMRQRNEQATNQLGIQTNEIFEANVSTTLSPLEMRKQKRKQFRERIKKLSPEEQELYYRKRAERKANKKRGVEHQVQ